MEKNLYIDASHPNETRVVLKSGDNIEDYEYEGLKNNLIKNNIYLGKVSRVEPSLMLRIQTKLELFLNLAIISKTTNTKV